MQKYCHGCKTTHDVSEFDRQKRNPKLFYAFCRAAQVNAYVNRRNSTGFKEEMQLLRDKAKQMRVLTPSQAVEIAERRQKGERAQELASEFKVSKAVIYKAAKSPQRYA